MKIREEETQSFFGFIVPVRQAMWVELLVIQVTIFVIVTFFDKNLHQKPSSPFSNMSSVSLPSFQVVVPNSSFLGHLAGILAGILYIKVPQSHSHLKICKRGRLYWLDPFISRTEIRSSKSSLLTILGHPRWHKSRTPYIKLC